MRPALKVIEGGLEEPGRSAPPVPPAVAGERLYPIFAPLGRRGAFFYVVAVSLVLHAAVLLASVDWNILGEERVAGGSDELVIIEGVDVTLLDRMPTVSLAEARPIDDADIAEATPATEARAVAGERRADTVPADRARLIADTMSATANAAAAAVVEPVEPLAIEVIPADAVAADAVTNDLALASPPPSSRPPPPTDAASLVPAERRSATRAARPVGAVPTDTATATQPVPANPAGEDRALRVVEATSVPAGQDAPADVASALQAESADVVRSVAAVPAVDATARHDKEPLADAADFAATLPTTPKDEPTVAVTEYASREPIDDAPAAAAEEIGPEPPLPRKNPFEIVASKPAARTASVAPKASAADPAARGPTKAKSGAGAGGATKAARGKANLSSYRSKLVAHLRRFRSYPAAARSRRLAGAASVRITIDRSGRVAAVSLAKSSGHGILDKAAIAMVRRASPFPGIPAGLGRSQITIRAPIRFDAR